jgi:putative acetyltransferase
MIHLIRTNSGNPDFQKLVALLDGDLAIRDGADHAFYAQFNKINYIRHAVVAYQNEAPVACGAFREYEANTVEIKRMFVQPEHRGKGIAGLVLQELENWVAELKYQACVLETGRNQPEAIRLYQKSGYSSIPNYGQYIGIANSVCMKKLIRL